MANDYDSYGSLGPSVKQNNLVRRISFVCVCVSRDVHVECEYMQGQETKTT